MMVLELWDSSIMMKAMEKAKENKWIIMSHAEDRTFSKIRYENSRGFNDYKRFILS